MVVWGLMMSNGDKSVWPDPASSCCIHFVAEYRGDCHSSLCCRVKAGAGECTDPPLLLSFLCSKLYADIDFTLSSHRVKCFIAHQDEQGETVRGSMGAKEALKERDAGVTQ